MAVNKTINKRTNTHGAMRNCIEYVLRQDKTSELLTYVTGPYRHDEIDYDLVYRTFLEEKKMWNKDTGRMYAHNIISWHKDEQITPEQAFEFGKEFAEKWFSGFQTLVAVHKDKNHIHCHLVTNSVSYEDGRKLHNTKKDLECMKQLTNQMCRERGLTIAEKGKHFDGSEIEKGEVFYHFVEIMACPGGCVNGGGQPVQPGSVRNFVDLRSKRAQALYAEDRGKGLRRSHENPVLQHIYQEFLEAPGSHKAHHILHTSFKNPVEK